MINYELIFEDMIAYVEIELVCISLQTYMFRQLVSLMMNTLLKAKEKKSDDLMFPRFIAITRNYQVTDRGFQIVEHTDQLGHWLSHTHWT